MGGDKQKILVDNTVLDILLKLLLKYSLLVQNIYSNKSNLNENKNKGVFARFKNLFSHKELSVFSPDIVISELSNTIHLICMSLSNEYRHSKWIFPMYAEYTKEFLELKFGRYEELEKIASAFPEVLDVLVEFGNLCRKRMEATDGDS